MTLFIILGVSSAIIHAPVPFVFMFNAFCFFLSAVRVSSKIAFYASGKLFLKFGLKIGAKPWIARYALNFMTHIAK